MAAHEPFRNYDRIPHRGTRPEERRRQWSQWTITVNPNITATDPVEQTELYALLIHTSRVIFTSPALLRLFMEPVAVTWRALGSGRTVQRDFTEDRFDGTHVFAHSFFANAETGSRFYRPHVMITYAALHDSAFQINTRTDTLPFDQADGKLSLPYLFASVFNDVLEASGSPALDVDNRRRLWRRTIEAGHPGVYVSVRAKRLYEEDEYKTKRDPTQRGTWSNVPDGMRRAGDPVTGRLLGAEENPIAFNLPAARTGEAEPEVPQSPRSQQLASRRAALARQ